MKIWLTVAAVMFVPMCSHAQTAKPCEELKSEIAGKLDAKGVKSYSLEIVAKDADAEGKAVGTCEGGTKKIMYRRGAAAAQATPAQPATSQAAAKAPDKP
jgi:Protein of unknown function (DUF1161)